MSKKNKKKHQNKNQFRLQQSNNSSLQNKTFSPHVAPQPAEENFSYSQRIQVLPQPVYTDDQEKIENPGENKNTLLNESHPFEVKNTEEVKDSYSANAENFCVSKDDNIQNPPDVNFERQNEILKENIIEEKNENPLENNFVQKEDSRVDQENVKITEDDFSQEKIKNTNALPAKASLVFASLFSIFLLLFALSVAITLVTRKSWNQGLKFQIEKVLNEKKLDYKAGKPFELSSALNTTLAVYNAGPDTFIVLAKVTSIYGPLPAVFIYKSGSSEAVFIDYVLDEDFAKETFIENTKVNQISFWAKKIKNAIDLQLKENESKTKGVE